MSTPSPTQITVFMNPEDIAALDLRPGDLITLQTVADDAVERSVDELQVVAYDIPRKALAGYYPELNELVPLWHHAEGSKVPAAKSVPVRISKPTIPDLAEEIPIAAS